MNWNHIVENGKPQHNSALAAWRERTGLNQRAAAAALGMSLSGYQELERGASFTTGTARSVRRSILLACAAIENDLGPISDDSARERAVHACTANE